MTKSRRNRSSSILKNVKRASMNTIPIVDKGITTVGVLAKGVAVKSVPVVEKGVSTVYGTLASGFNLGEKGAKMVAKGITNRRSKRHKKSKGKNSRKN